jgi:hypothetical protein
MAQPADLAVLGLVVDASGAIKGIQAAEGKLVSLEQSFGKVQKAAAVAFGAGLGLAIGLVVKNTIEAERAFTLLEARVKATGGAAGFTAEQLARMAGDLQKVSTFGDEAIMDMQRLLLSFKSIRGDTFIQAQKAIIDLGAQMGSLEQAATVLGKALADPERASRMLKSAGVDLTDAQKQGIETAIKLNDVMRAQSIILQAVQDRSEGTALAMRNTLGGALTALREAFGDLFEAPENTGGITAAINGLTDNLKTATRIAVVLGATIATALFGGAVAGAFASITAALKALNVAIGISTVAAQGLRAVMATMGGPWVAGITAAVLALGSAWVYFAGKADEAKNASDDLKKSLDELSYKGIEQKFAEKIKEIENATRQLQQLGGAGSTIAVEKKREEINALEDEARAITKVLQERQKLIRGGAGVALPSVAVVFDPEAEAKAKEARDKETKRIDDYLDKLRSQIAELNKLREEFAVRSTAAMDMSGAGTADLQQQIKERDEYTDAVEKGANTELRLLIALTQAREEYRKALGTGATALPLMAGPEATTTDVVDPPLGALPKWKEFLASISELAAQVGENMGDAFMETFSNIAARGKVTFGDLFATASGILKSIGGKAAAFAKGPLAVAAVGASILESVISRGDAERKAAIDALNADMDAFNDAIKSFADSFRVQGSRFEEETRRINEFLASQREKITELDSLLTITAFRALEGVRNSPAGAGMSEGEQVDAAIEARSKSLRALGKDPATDVAIKQLMEYKRQLEALNKTTEEAIEAAKKAREERNKEMQGDLEVRRLQALGQDDEAKALRNQMARDREIAQAVANDADETTMALLRLVHGLEAAADAAKELEEAERVERERQFTIGGLDAAIAREKGNTEEADAIERDIERQRILAEVTDATIQAKYEELWALEDTNRAARKAAEAIQLLADQAAISEDLEVRKLMATGKTMEAEELRFQLEQKRELLRAEADFASGLITQEILDQLREVLGLEADVFANRNLVPPSNESAASAQRGGAGQISNLATAQVQDIDRVVGELTTIRVRAGQLVQLMTALVRGGGILGVVNAGIQGQTQNQSLLNGNLVVS